MFFDNEEENEDEEEMEEIENDILGLEYNEENEPTGEDQPPRNNEEAESLYEISLSSQHQYLGATEELSGRTIISENEYVTIPILRPSLSVDVVLLPNQTLPLTITEPMVQSMLRKAMAKDKIFGMIHTRFPSIQYGTTAEIFEYQDDESTGKLSIKAKGRQRFTVVNMHREVTGCVVARVKILPNIVMLDPLTHVRPATHQVLNMSNSCDEAGQKLVTRNVSSLRSPASWRARRRTAMLTPWPSWVYDMYEDKQLALRLVNEIVECFKDQSNIQIPCDPDELSHWASMNLPLSDSHRINLLSLNSSTQRLRFILSFMKQILKSRKLICRMCNKSVAEMRDVFSMSTDGPQGTFVNPDGYVHEMITVTKAVGLRMNGRPSTMHSWFPGYSWQIASCKTCHSHIGWLFKCAKSKLKPSMFYGLTRKSLNTFTAAEEVNPMTYII